MNIIPDADPIPIGEAIADASRALLANSKTLVRIWGLTCILPGLFISTACSVASLNSDSFAPGIRSRDPRIIGALILISLVWIGARVLAFSMVAVMCAHSVHATVPQFKPLPSDSVSRLASAVGTLFLVLLAWFLGLVFLVLPALYLLIRFSLALSSACVDGRWPISAMRRSWALTRGRFWNAAGLVVFVYGVEVPLWWGSLKFNAYIADTVGTHGSVGGALAGLMMNSLQFVLTAWISAGLTAYFWKASRFEDRFTAG